VKLNKKIIFLPGTSRDGRGSKKLNRKDCGMREQAGNMSLACINGNNARRKIRCQPTKHIRCAVMLTDVTIRIINVPVHLFSNPSEK
jgi:hypothetical protein